MYGGTEKGISSVALSRSCDSAWHNAQHTPEAMLWGFQQ